MEPLGFEDARRWVNAALAEDVGSGDVTTTAMIPPEAVASARMVARQELVVCGLSLAEAAFRELDPAAFVERAAEDGQRVARGALLLRVRGSARALLTAERVALNFVQRLSGIATLTARYVAAVNGSKAQILDTRKTTPCWRRLEKYAVRCGGGRNHRFGLFDQVLIKDNHLAALRGAAPDPVTAAVERARRLAPGLTIEVEADTLDQAALAAAAGADVILLDNMSPAQLSAAVNLVAGRARTEASGGITLETAPAIAATGVDFLSVGALTHSAASVDIGLDFDE